MDDDPETDEDGTEGAGGPSAGDGSPAGGDADDGPAGATASGDPDRSNVEVTDAGESRPADPKWEKPDPEEIPEFETGAEEPVMEGHGADMDEDPTAGMPNTARSPGSTRLKEGGTEAYIAALELCARLPDDVALPAEAADLVPVALEAELEQDVQSFAAAEFDNPSPHVETLSFVEADGDIWLRLRLGVPPEALADLEAHTDAIEAHALQQLEGMF